MKTTTIRIDDDLMELVDEVANLTKRPPSEIMRTGIREYIRILAERDERIQKIRNEIYERQVSAQTEAIRRKLGMDPLGSPDQA
jgi:predicted transcriptional regulator